MFSHKIVNYIKYNTHEKNYKTDQAIIGKGCLTRIMHQGTLKLVVSQCFKP